MWSVACSMHPGQLAHPALPWSWSTYSWPAASFPAAYTWRPRRRRKASPCRKFTPWRILHTIGDSYNWIGYWFLWTDTSQTVALPIEIVMKLPSGFWLGPYCNHWDVEFEMTWAWNLLVKTSNLGTGDEPSWWVNYLLAHLASSLGGWTMLVPKVCFPIATLVLAGCYSYKSTTRS